MRHSFQWLAVALCSAFAAASASAEKPRTECAGKVGHEFQDAAILGVELVPGLTTGMSRDAVKRRVPDLVGDRGQVELLPGKFYRAELSFGKLGTEWLSGLEIKGSWQNDPKDALTERLGQPLDISEMNTGWNVNRDNAKRLGDVERLKWCDHGRVLVLYSDPDKFTLNITTEARRTLPLQHR